MPICEAQPGWTLGQRSLAELIFVTPTRTPETRLSLGGMFMTNFEPMYYIYVQKSDPIKMLQLPNVCLKVQIKGFALGNGEGENKKRSENKNK